MTAQPALAERDLATYHDFVERNPTATPVRAALAPESLQLETLSNGVLRLLHCGAHGPGLPMAAQILELAGYGPASVSADSLPEFAPRFYYQYWSPDPDRTIEFFDQFMHEHERLVWGVHYIDSQAGMTLVSAAGNIQIHLGGLSCGPNGAGIKEIVQIICSAGFVGSRAEWTAFVQRRTSAKITT